MALSPRALPSLIFWGMKFLYNSTPKNFDSITKNLFSLGNYSKKLTQDFREKYKISYDETAVGTIKIYREQENLDKAVALQERIFDNSNLSSILGYRAIDKKRTSTKRY
jgi:D-amino-acid dehydrogenase